MIKVVFFGTPEIALKSLEYLYNSDKIEVVAVVTQPDKPSGRGHKMTASPIKEFAIVHNLPVFQPKSIRKEPEIQSELQKLEPDFFVTFAFRNMKQLTCMPRFFRSTEVQILFSVQLLTGIKKQVFVQ